jgi:transposase
MCLIDNKTRENIISAKQRNEKREIISLWLGISISTIDKVWKRFKETGSFLPTPYTGRKSNIGTETDERIRNTIKEIPDITLVELIEELSLPLSISGLYRKLNRMGLSYKKRQFTLQTGNALMYKKDGKIGRTISQH